MNKLFCIGFPKTGTTSLENALKILGYKVCNGHYNNNRTNYLVGLFLNKDYKELDRIIGYFDAFCDIPFGGTDFYIYLSKKYPEAKFIHTIRDDDAWYTSLLTMLTEFDDNQETALDTFHKHSRYGATYYVKREFEIENLSGNKDKIIDHYRQSNKAIEEFFKDQPNRYLNIDIAKDKVWEKLGKYLNKPIPNVPFPHANKAHTKASYAKDEQLEKLKKNGSMKSRLKQKIISFIKKM